MYFRPCLQEHPVITVGYLNCLGQTGFTISKQKQLETFLQNTQIDILHLQETKIEDDTFAECNFIASNYSVLQNNNQNQYGTASLVRNSYFPEDVILHQSGRIIIFNIGNTTFGNVYLPSGTDGQSRASRESFSGEIIPTLMINSRPNGLIGGDWNNIIPPVHCTNVSQSEEGC